jgi:hypothetical protein
VVSFAPTSNGETVVDVWGGHRDEARTTPWTEHTLVNVWSTTKTVTELAMLSLVAGCWRSCGRCRWAGRPAVFGCSRRTPSTWCSSRSSRGSTWCSACRSGSDRVRAGLALGALRPVRAYLLLGRLADRDGPGPALTISYMMNRLAPGIIGSDGSQADVEAVHAALD